MYFYSTVEKKQVAYGTRTRKRGQTEFPKTKGRDTKRRAQKVLVHPKKTPKVQSSACFSDHGLPKTSVFVMILHQLMGLKLPAQQ